MFCERPYRDGFHCGAQGIESRFSQGSAIPHEEGKEQHDHDAHHATFWAKQRTARRRISIATGGMIEVLLLKRHSYHVVVRADEELVDGAVGSNGRLHEMAIERWIACFSGASSTRL